MDNDREFKNWFDAIWLGDEDSGQFIPNQKDEDYAEYLEQYTLAHGAYKYALAHSKERIAELEKDAERLATLDKSIQTLRDCTEIQCSDGNWNFESYMHGMANGMIFALSLFDNVEPKYLEAPKNWIKDNQTKEMKIEAMKGSNNE